MALFVGDFFEKFGGWLVYLQIVAYVYKENMGRVSPSHVIFVIAFSYFFVRQIG